ncbi:amino acid adenylation domain-containing protein, partial [Sphingobacterium hotanense]|uniref:amino acid adenylation domain-containing protein n=1 Tax=Sphingobacterium hotanense TaxID=649196 RepID=UPI0021A854C5
MTNKLIHNIIESRVLEHPSRLALTGYGLELSYGELNSYANRLAHGLISLGYSDGGAVGVYAEGGPLQVVALLACFKAGAVYVPMSSEQAENHLLQVMKETDMQAVVTISEHAVSLREFLSDHSIEIETVIVLNRPSRDSFPLIFEGKRQINDSALNSSNPSRVYDLNSSSYVFYTSGSTGRSKGIVGSHASLSHYIQWHQQEWGVDGSFRISQLAPMTFDASLKDVLTGLTAGATVCCAENEVKNNSALLVEWLRLQEITMLQTVPSVFRLITGSLKDSGIPLPSLRYVVLAGERLYGLDVVNWKNANGTLARLSNMYGLTETTILKTCFHVNSWDWQAGDLLPVGSPITNTMVAIVNNEKLCVSGEIGEIYIKSPYISKGYIDQSFNEDRLVQNPLSNDDNDFVWRTGDLGRYLDDGNLEILGRRDEQVKINGVRVELEQVRVAVMEQEGVVQTELFVHTGEDLRQELLCYYTGTEYTPNELRAQLSKKLNVAMLPDYYVWMESFPLNLNGKVDRKALPKPQEMLLKSGYEEPREGLEKQLADIWYDVLGVGTIGRKDNFFNIGGSSLKAMQVVTKVYKELDVKLTIADIFNSPVLHILAEYVSTKSTESYFAIPKVEFRDSYPVSNSQKRLWILSQIPEQSVAYNIVPMYKIQGLLDIAALAGAFQLLSERHESLRTVFFSKDGEIRQRILPIDHPGSGLVLRSFNGPDAEVQAYEHATKIASEPLDLINGPLVKTELLKIAKNEYLLVWCIHHIISDEWSMGVMVREIINAYNALSEGKEPEFMKLPIQYKDYAVWQQTMLLDESFTSHRKFWLSQFEGELPVLELPTDYTRRVEKRYQGAKLHSSFTKSDSKAFLQLTRNKDLTPFMGLLALVKTLLFRYSGQGDMIIGTPVAGRDHPNLESQIGYYLNTLALRSQIIGEDTFMELMDRIRTTTISAFAHKAYPFDLLIEDLQVRSTPGRSPLFDTMVVWQTGVQTDEAEPTLDDVEIQRVNLSNAIAKFDLTFFFEINEDIINFQIEYDTDLFREERIELMAEHFKGILKSILQSPKSAIKNLRYLSDKEENLILHSFNNTDKNWMLTGNDLVSCFERQASIDPDKTALVCGEKTISFGELNLLSNRLANRLLSSHGLKRNQLIGISTARNEYLLISILGVLKAGGGYVPLDPTYPTERVDYIIKNSRLLLILTDDDREYAEATSLNLSLTETLKGYETTGSLIVREPEDIAYVIYTSGSTGLPKGVIIQHKAILNYIYWSNNFYFNSGLPYVFPVFTSISFDLTITSLLGGLYRGDTVVLYPETNLEEVLGQMFRSLDFNAIKITPAHIELLHSIGVNLKHLDVIIVGGEELTDSHVERLMSITRSDALIFNEYGPTEATVGCVATQVTDVTRTHEIGTPIANTKIYILDERQELLPIGVRGELCVTGDCVALGYLNDDQLTDERFIPNAFGQGKLYRTGDIASWTADGNIIFYGRKDNQVKIRGYRIETGEIEGKLVSSGLVREVTVIVYHKEDEKSLAAYYTADTTVATDILRGFLHSCLPQYMIPTFFRQLEKMPLTNNGKIDRNLLPSPISQSKVYRTAGTFIERTIARIWEEVLNRRPIGLDDNFFEIGGQSLKALQVIHGIYSELSVKLNLRDLFLCPVLSQLVALVEASRQPTIGSIPRVVRQPNYPLSHAQRRLWVISQLEDQSLAYNISLLYRLKGQVNVEALSAAFRQLIDRHESLRTNFVIEKGEPRQQVLEIEECNITLELLDYSTFEDPESHAIAHANTVCDRIFDLEKGPLFRAELLRESSDSHLLVCCMHHIISDEWSLQIMVKELIQCYNAFIKGNSPDLNNLPIQYKDYASWQQLDNSQESFADDRQYWLSLFEGELPVLELPADYIRPAIQRHRGSLLRGSFKPEQSLKFRRLLQEHQATPFMGVLALVSVFLHRYSGQSDLIIGTPVTGRNHPDLSDQIGYYLNTLALRQQLKSEASFLELLERTRINTIDAFSHQAYPFDLLVDELEIRRDLSRSPLFDVMVVWQSEGGDSESYLDGLTGESLGLEQTVSKFDLTFFFEEVSSEVNFRIEYNTDIFNRTRIERMMDHLQAL